MDCTTNLKLGYSRNKVWSMITCHYKSKESCRKEVRCLATYVRSSSAVSTESSTRGTLSHHSTSSMEQMSTVFEALGEGDFCLGSLFPVAKKVYR